MAGHSFDPYDWQSFYFGRISRQDADRMLSEDHVEPGTFLLRDSSKQGDYSLSVREGTEDAWTIRHYLISQATDDDLNKCIKIGDKSFSEMPDLLNYYKIRLLDSCALHHPYVQKPTCTVMAKWRYSARDESELSIVEGEMLENVGNYGENWMRVRNSIGRIGVVPANYVGEPEFIQEEPTSASTSAFDFDTVDDVDLTTMDAFDEGTDATETKFAFPLWGRVKETYATAVRGAAHFLKQGDFVRISRILPTGWGFGRIFTADEVATAEETIAQEAASSPDGSEVGRKSPYERMYAQPGRHFEAMINMAVIELVQDPVAVAQVKERKKYNLVPGWDLEDSLYDKELEAEDRARADDEDDFGVVNITSWM